MNERSFIVWEVWAVLNGREKCVVALPYRQANDATTWAKYLPRGYVLRSRADREPDGCFALSLSDGSRSWEFHRDMPEPQPEPEPARVPTATETPIVKTVVKTSKHRAHSFATG